MSINYLRHIEYIDHLIFTKSTGTPKQFASKLSISERTLYNYLTIMKEFGAPIVYSKNRQSYYYKCEGRFFMRFWK